MAKYKFSDWLNLFGIGASIYSQIRSRVAKNSSTTPPPDLSSFPTLNNEDYYDRKTVEYKDQLNTANSQVDTNRQKNIGGAYAAYEQNKATYGRNAEQLAQMGLTGSGYSDYINSQAYAQQRQDIQSANTNSETAKLANQVTYDGYISDLNDNKFISQQAIYEKVRVGALNGMYNSQGIEAYAKKHADELNWSYEQKKELQSLADSYKENYYVSLEDGTIANLKIGNANDISQAISTGKITNKTQLDGFSKYTGDKYDSLLKEIQNKRVGEINADIKTNGMSNEVMADINSLIASGDLTRQQGSGLYKVGWSNDILGSKSENELYYVLNDINDKKNYLSTQDYDELIKAIADKRARLNNSGGGFGGGG